MIEAPLRRIELQCIVWGLFAFGAGGTLASDTLLLHFMESSGGQWNSVLPFLYREYVGMVRLGGFAGGKFACNPVAGDFGFFVPRASIPGYPRRKMRRWM